MKPDAVKVLCMFCAFAAIILSGSSSDAMLFNFVQGGYSGGGVISGYFDAVDRNSDGQISSFDGEVTGFSLSFAGDSLVGGFSHGMSDLTGVVYNIGSGFIGDGTGGGIDGLASNYSGSAGFDYASGIGILGEFGGRVIDIASGTASVTAELISVSAVPAPDSMILFGTSIITLAGIMIRRNKETSL